MAENLPPDSRPSSSSAMYLRRIGLLVFVFGLATAAVIGYFEITQPAESPTDSLTDGYYKSQSFQMQKMVGNIGPVSLTLREDLARTAPAIFIAVLAVIVAFTCFVRAGRLDRSDS